MFCKQFSNLIYKPYIYNISKCIFAWDNKIPNKNLVLYIHTHTHTHTHKGTLIDHTKKKEWNSAIYNNMDRSWSIMLCEISQTEKDRLLESYIKCKNKIWNKQKQIYR